MAEEIAPALTDLPVAAYWRGCRARFANPRLDHGLTQIGEDGSSKLAQRIFPLLIENARAGRPTKRMAAIVRAWLELAGEGRVKDQQSARLRAWAGSGCGLAGVLNEAALVPDAVRGDPALRAAMIGSEV